MAGARIGTHICALTVHLKSSWISDCLKSALFNAY
jgi:hypothetical protein